MAEASCQLTRPCQQHQLISRQLQSTKRDRGDQAGAGSLLARVCEGIWLERQGGSRVLFSVFIVYPCPRPRSGVSWCPPKFVSSGTVCCVAKTTPCICTAAPGLPLNETAIKNSSLPQPPKSFHICVHECMCVCKCICAHPYVCVHMNTQVHVKVRGQFWVLFLR